MLRRPLFLICAGMLISTAVATWSGAAVFHSNPSQPARASSDRANLQKRIARERTGVHREIAHLVEALLEGSDDDGGGFLLLHEEHRLVAELAARDHAVLSLSMPQEIEDRVLANEPPRAWLSDGTLELERLRRLLAERDEPTADKVMLRFAAFERITTEATSLRRDVIPSAERALATALEGLIRREVPLVDVLSAMQLVEVHKLAAVDTRERGELLLLDLAQLLGCSVEELPWKLTTPPAERRPRQRSTPPLHDPPSESGEHQSVPPLLHRVTTTGFCDSRTMAPETFPITTRASAPCP